MDAGASTVIGAETRPSHAPRWDSGGPADPGRPLLPVQHGRALPSPTVSRAALPARPPSASQETGAQRLLSSQQEAPVCLAPVAPYPVAPSAGSVLVRPGCRDKLPRAEQQHLRPTVTEAGSSRPRRRQMQGPVRCSSWHVDGRLLAVSPRGGRQEEGALVSLLIRHRSHPGAPPSEPHHRPGAPPPAAVARGSAFDVCFGGNANIRPTTGSSTPVLMSGFSRSRHSVGACAEPVTSFPAEAPSPTPEPTLPVTALSPRRAPRPGRHASEPEKQAREGV